jgi:hypothetical protein
MANSSSGNLRIRKKAQSIAESSLMLVAAVLFFLGIWRIGLWYNNEVAERQSAYQASRVDAGSDEIGQWPIYTRRPLTENWVLGGEEFPLPAQPSIGNGGGPGRERRVVAEEN